MFCRSRIIQFLLRLFLQLIFQGDNANALYLCNLFLITDLTIFEEILHLTLISANAVFKDSLMLKVSLAKLDFSSTKMVSNWVLLKQCPASYFCQYKISINLLKSKYKTSTLHLLYLIPLKAIVFQHILNKVTVSKDARLM